MLWLLRQADACRRGITRHPRFVEISGATIVCIVPVGLAAPHAPDFMSVADGDVDACIQKGVVGSHPVDARALHEDLLDAERTEEFDKGLQSLLEEGVELGPHELAPERVGAYGDNGGHDGKRLVDVYACGSGIQIDDGF